MIPAGYIIGVNPTTVPSPVPTDTANSAAIKNTTTTNHLPVRPIFIPAQTVASTSPEAPSIAANAPAQSQQTTATVAVRFAIRVKIRSL